MPCNTRTDNILNEDGLVSQHDHTQAPAELSHYSMHSKGEVSLSLLYVCNAGLCTFSKALLEEDRGNINATC